ncbi:MAG: cysteine desulfurase family protein [Bacteroidota bacterium]
MTAIYLDHAATTPVDPRVKEAMLPYFDLEYGNPSSVHRLGRKARFVIEECRERVAALIGAEPSEVIFTSGGTESDNLAVRGGLMASGRPHGVTSAAEHEAVLRPFQRLGRRGEPVTVLRPAGNGSVSVRQLEEVLQPETGLVSFMHANNEVGTLSPIAEMVELCRRNGTLMHTDAVQTAGLMPLDVGELGVDLMSASAHKFYGPKGAGLLFIRSGVDLHPLIEGGAQERRRRGGTENVPAIAGLTEALTLARQEGDEWYARILSLRRRLLNGLAAMIPGEYRLNTPQSEDQTVPGIVNLSFPPSDGHRLDGEMLLLNLDMEGVLVSAGSACTSGAVEPSHVLRAMAVPDDTAAASVRFSLGKGTTDEEIDRAIDVLTKTLRRMKRQVTA